MAVRSLIGLAALTVVTAGVAFNVTAIPRPVDNMINDWLGETISMSADGLFAVTGSSGKNNYEGQAYVYGRTGSTWSVIQTLSPPANSRYFAYKLAMSADASTIAASAEAASPSTNASITIFARNAGTNTWSRAQVLSPGDVNPNESFDDVTLSSDGSFVVSSARWHSNDYYITEGTGGAWVWKRTGTVYAQQGGTLRGNVYGAYVHFGSSAAISADGSVLVVTSERVAVNGRSQAGAAYIYTAATNWALVQNLTASDAQTSDRFGTMARLTSDGSTIAISSVGVSTYAGAVYIFTRSGASWTQTAKLNDTSGTGGRYAAFGSSLALAPDASWLLVGSSSSACSFGSCGSVQVFNRTASGGWQQYPNYLVTQDRTSSSFGNSVAGSSPLTPGSGSSWALLSDPYNGVNNNGTLYAVDLATLIPPPSPSPSPTPTATASMMSAAPTSTSSATSTWSTGAVAPMAAPRSAEPISTGGAVGLAIGAAAIAGIVVLAIVLLRSGPAGAPVPAGVSSPARGPTAV